MRRLFVALLGTLVIAAVTPAFAGPDSAGSASARAALMHRFLIKRTFPAGALDGLDQVAKNKINATNAKFHVRWIHSYATADKQTTFCIYEAPSERAIRDAAQANNIPVDTVVEIPVTLNPHGKDLVVR